MTLGIVGEWQAFWLKGVALTDNSNPQRHVFHYPKWDLSTDGQMVEKTCHENMALL